MKHELVGECPACESTDIESEVVTLRRAFGLPAVTLTNVSRIICRECNETSTSFPQHGYLMRRIRWGLCFIGRTLRGAEFSFLRTALGLSQKDVSELFGVSNVTVSRWENDVSTISQQTDLLIRVLTLQNLECVASIAELSDALAHRHRTFEIDLCDLASSNHTEAFEHSRPEGRSHGVARFDV